MKTKEYRVFGSIDYVMYEGLLFLKGEVLNARGKINRYWCVHNPYNYVILKEHQVVKLATRFLGDLIEVEVCNESY